MGLPALFEWVDAEPLREWYEPDGDPREALGRMARRLKGGGALYLGGGVGVESTRSVQAAGGAAVQIERYKVTPNGSTHDGPLSAVTAAFTAAGGSAKPDTPGGVQKVSDPAIAARLHELDASEREENARVRRYELRAANRAKQGPVGYGNGYGLGSDDQWETRALEEARANIASIAVERKRLLAGKVEEREMEPLGMIGVSEAGTAPEPFSTSKTSNWVAKAGGLPTFIQHVAHDILESPKSKVKTTSEAIAIAVSQAKKLAAKGNKQAAAAVAQWEKMKASSHVTEAALVGALALAEGRLGVVDDTLGAGAAATLALGGSPLGEACAADIELLAFAGDARALALTEGNPAWHRAGQARHRDGKWTNVLDRVRKSGESHPLQGPDLGLRLNTPHPEAEPVSEAWSEAARKAALEARRLHHHAMPSPADVHTHLRGMGGRATAIGLARRMGHDPAGFQKHLATVPGVENRNGIWHANVPDGGAISKGLDAMGGKATAVGLARSLGADPHALQAALAAHPGVENVNGLWRKKAAKARVAEVDGGLLGAMQEARR